MLKRRDSRFIKGRPADVRQRRTHPLSTGKYRGPYGFDVFSSVRSWTCSVSQVVHVHERTSSGRLSTTHALMNYTSCSPTSGRAAAAQKPRILSSKRWRSSVKSCLPPPYLLSPRRGFLGAGGSVRRRLQASCSCSFLRSVSARRSSISRSEGSERSRSVPSAISRRFSSWRRSWSGRPVTIHLARRSFPRCRPSWCRSEGYCVRSRFHTGPCRSPFVEPRTLALNNNPSSPQGLTAAWCMIFLSDVSLGHGRIPGARIKDTTDYAMFRRVKVWDRSLLFPGPGIAPLAFGRSGWRNTHTRQGRRHRNEHHGPDGGRHRRARHCGT